MNTTATDSGWPSYLLADFVDDDYPAEGDYPSWRQDPATFKQIEALERRGLCPPVTLTKGQASHALNLASPRQLALLERRGLWNAANDDVPSFARALELLGSLARSEGWKK